MVPAGLSVSQVMFAREETWGFGPGGNETGVIIFKLPVDIAGKIERNGIAFLHQYVPTLIVVRHGDERPVTLRWKATPVLVEGSGNDTNLTQTYDIEKYLNRFGFGLILNDEVTREINDALSSQGNFVDDNGRRLMVIMPKTGRVVIAYRG